LNTGTGGFRPEDATMITTYGNRRKGPGADQPRCVGQPAPGSWGKMTLFHTAVLVG